MNPFWKTILGTLLGAVSLVGAKYSANWIADHTYRVKPAPRMLAEMPKPVYAPVRHFMAPTHYRRRTPDYPIRPYRSRH